MHMEKNKVVFICIDGMRPDAIEACGNEFAIEFMKKSSYTLKARTVYPSSTLPCHMSMFYSVPPQVHGTMGEYVKPDTSLKGLFEHVCNMGENKCSMYYGWQPLRMISPPRCLVLNAAEYINSYAAEGTDGMLTDKFLRHAESFPVGFAFLYMVETDEKGGHDNGWMSEEYLHYLSKAWDNVKRVYEKLGDEYTIIVTADHGGHDHGHGTQMDEDMTIPMFFYGKQFEAGKELEDISIMDIAPTVSKILGLEPHESWQGKPLL